MENQFVKKGKYRHFKGMEYEVLGVGKHSETQEEMVVYKALYGEGGREDCDNPRRRNRLLLLERQEHLRREPQRQPATLGLLTRHGTGDARPEDILPYITQLHRIDQRHREHLEIP